MDTLINVVLPLALAFIMLSLGIGLTFGDFARVLKRLHAFGIGAGAQLILIPLTTYIIVRLFGLPAELGLGFMLLSFCPGGVTSNMITKLAKGDVALSVSLTAIISLLSILTVPFLAAWAVVHFLGSDGPDVSVTSLAVSMFLITTLPVLIGVTIRHLAPTFAQRAEPVFSTIASILFVVLIIAVLAGNWDTFIANLTTLGPALIALIVTLMLVGLAVAKAAGLTWREVKTISLETGVQNATLGITLAAIISGQASGFSTMALPSAVYGILMYLVAAPFVIWYRSK
jgi:BASS family bile acid:Na+ symporter